MITIVDYGMGNLGSVQNMFKRIGVESEISGDPDNILKSTKLLLPGVGAFDAAMQRLNESGLILVLNQKVLIEKIPILGICLGMQLLTLDSEEGKLPGLGWIDAHTLKFQFKENDSLKVPHMGWNKVKEVRPSLLSRNFEAEPRFYFVHSYYVTVTHQQNSIMKTLYGIDFDSVIEYGNIFGAQFHPEKSHKFGMKLFQNFSDL